MLQWDVSAASLAQTSCRLPLPGHRHAAANGTAWHHRLWAMTSQTLRGEGERKRERAGGSLVAEQQRMTLSRQPNYYLSLFIIISYNYKILELMAQLIKFHQKYSEIFLLKNVPILCEKFYLFLWDFLSFRFFFGFIFKTLVTKGNNWFTN